MNSMFTKIVRIVLGLALVVFGANMILHFIPMDHPDIASKAGQFMNSLGATGYGLSFLSEVVPTILF